MASRVSIDAELVRSRIEALKAAYPDLADDAELLASTIEGETDFDRVMDRLARGVVEADAFAEGAAEVQKQIMARRARFERSSKALRELAMDLMRTAEQRSVVTPTATFSVQAGRQSVIVDDINKLPQGFTKVEKIARATEIKKALEAGDDIDGAHLQPGPDYLTIRTI